MSTVGEDLRYPVLPLRDIVVFPHMVVPLFVGRERSVSALDYVMQADEKHLLLVTQKNATEETPEMDSLHRVGTIAKVLQLLKLPDGTVKVLVEGVGRVQVREFSEHEGFFKAFVQKMDVSVTHNDELEALIRTVVAQFEQYVKLNRKIPPDVLVAIAQINDPGKLADTIASYFSLKITEKQALLENTNVNDRLEKILVYIENENNILQVEKRIKTRVKKQMEKTQRDYYLNEQLKAIHKELGEGENGKDEIGELEEKARKTKLSKEGQQKVQSELKKLRMMTTSSAEATVVRNYLEWVLGIPWQIRSKVRRNLNDAAQILDEDHYGLQKVKERILEYLAVQSRVGKIKGQILCLVGPPGVGKTSLGKSIAKATGRSFVRVSLGGVRDESEIRGHRRTYIGSMPGKIIQGMKKAKTTNPLFLLDEIDKLGSDYRGDPASALLEVLDPEQNAAFSDHYLDMDYDLSDVMFVTTANSLNMPQPLLDRMEVIRLSGYTELEKMSISKLYLVPKQIELNGLKEHEFTITDNAVLMLIRRYTREAGVRNLEREIANLARKIVKKVVTEKEKSVHINVENLLQYAGVPRYSYGELDKDDQVGFSTGLAWTEVGGELLTIEAVVVLGHGKLLITGKLGEVMQESVQAAISYVRVRSHEFGIKAAMFDRRDIHVHLPEGAIPKDGPSAGISVCTAIISALTGIAVHKDVAMTGEITLRGRVLGIGGLKEKLLAALRGGIKTVIIPFDNKKDLSEIPDEVKEGLTIIPVHHIDEVLKIALTRDPISISFEESEESFIAQMERHKENSVSYLAPSLEAFRKGKREYDHSRP